MFDRFRTLLLAVLRVPPQPEPPFGAAGSLRVFRAGRNYYKLRLLGWTLGQLGALIGIVFSFGFLAQINRAAADLRNAPEPTPSLAPADPAPPADPNAAPAPEPAKKPKSPTPKVVVTRLAKRIPGWILPTLSFLEYAALAVFFLQALVTYALLRLDFEMRWYMVTDRSLRIRSGTWNVQETTMSFANLQQVVLSQGPLQRLLGLADLRVESAGGGAGLADQQHGPSDSMHTAFFHGVDNAAEVRDLILERLRHFRAAGLGDPEDSHAIAPPGAPSADPQQPHPALSAARAILAEARALRHHCR